MSDPFLCVKACLEGSQKASAESAGKDSDRGVFRGPVAPLQEPRQQAWSPRSELPNARNLL